MNELFYNNPKSVQDFLWLSIKDLPKESIDEILSFVLYIRKKNFQPELINLEYELLNEELHKNSIHETQHLEEEFENYKDEFPHK